MSSTATPAATCVMALPNDGAAAVLVNSADPAELERTMQRLGYPPGSYSVGRARLAHASWVEDWDREHYIAFGAGR